MAGLNPFEVNGVTGVAVTPAALPFPVPPRLLLLTLTMVGPEKAPAKAIYNEAVAPPAGAIGRLNVMVELEAPKLPAWLMTSGWMKFQSVTQRFCPTT